MRTLILVRKQAEVLTLRGKLEWQGDIHKKMAIAFQIQVITLADISLCQCPSNCIHMYGPLSSKKRATRLRREGGRILLDSYVWLSSCFQNPKLQKAETRR